MAGSGFRISVASQADVGDVYRLLEASYSRLLVPFYSPDVLQAALPRITRPSEALLTSGRYYIIGAGMGAPAGVGGWSHEAPGEAGVIVPGLGHLRYVGTHPEMTGHGIGRALLEHIFAQAREEGVHSFDCFSTLMAVRFYERFGFSQLEQTEIPMGEGISLPVVRMHRGSESLA